MPGTEHDVTQGVSFSGDGRTLIAATAAGVIQLWDVAERRRITALRASSELECVAFTADGRFVAGGGADAVLSGGELTQFTHGFRVPATNTAGQSVELILDLALVRVNDRWGCHASAFPRVAGISDEPERFQADFQHDLDGSPSLLVHVVQPGLFVSPCVESISVFFVFLTQQLFQFAREGISAVILRHDAAVDTSAGVIIAPLVPRHGCLHFRRLQPILYDGLEGCNPNQWVPIL
jgi:hypothetical protein